MSKYPEHLFPRGMARWCKSVDIRLEGIEAQLDLVQNALKELGENPTTGPRPAN
jgi:hypothetical protein